MRVQDVVSTGSALPGEMHNLGNYKKKAEDF
jgi:hypothetical protein